MAVQYNILERYGIKEVADVTFIDLDTGRPVLYLDSLKVSTIEETAETTDARGGKGNAPLLSWDYGKEITVTITDALYSPKSLTLMHSQNLSDLHVYTPDQTPSSTNNQKASSGLNVTKYKNLYVTDKGEIEGSELTLPTGVTTSKTIAQYWVDQAIAGPATASETKGVGEDAQKFLTNIGADSKEVKKLVAVNGAYIRVYRAEDNALYNDTKEQDTDKKFTTIENGQVYIIEYVVEPAHKSRLEISAHAFPGTYKVVGDTYARNNRTGQDQFFQFVINKAKINPETTITLEAEGDPTVFDMSLKVLRPNNGVMMELIQYDFDAVTESGTGNAVNVHHLEAKHLYPDAGIAGPEAED